MDGLNYQKLPPYESILVSCFFYGATSCQCRDHRQKERAGYGLYVDVTRELAVRVQLTIATGKGIVHPPEDDWEWGVQLHIFGGMILVPM